MIKNIIFDMGGVLIDWAPLNLINNTGVYGDDAQIIIEELFKEYEWIALDAGTITPQEAFNSVSKRIDPKLHEALKYLIEKWWEFPFIYKQGMEELIRELHQNGYKIYLLSNANIFQKDYFHRIPGVECFSGRVTSAEIQLLKPSIEIYEYICNEYKLNKEECFYVDDSNMNIYFARKYGFSAYVFHDVERLRKDLISEGINLKG